MKFDYYNENTDIVSESLQNLKNEIIKMNDQVNIARKELMERGEKVGELENKSNGLKEASVSFKQGAIKLRKSTTKKKIYIYLGLFLSLFIIIYFIIVMACHSWTFQC